VARLAGLALPGPRAVISSAPGYWHGTIDELAVYSSALAGTNIAIHNSKFLFGTNTSPPSIVSQTTGPRTCTLAARRF